TLSSGRGRRRWRHLHRSPRGDPDHPQGDPARRHEARLADPETPLITMRARRFPAAPLILAVAIASGCALAPPPTPDEVRTQALPNVTVAAASPAPGGTARD